VQRTGIAGRVAASEGLKAEIERNFRFNFAALLAHGLLGQTGFRLVQAPTFLPHYVSLLAGNNSAVGIARAVQSLGMFLSPILAARTIEHRPKVKRLGILYGSAMRIQFLFLGLIALYVPASSALPLVWAVLFLFGLALGMQGVVFNYVISKTVPVDRRGILLGLRDAAAGLTLLLVSWIGGYLVGHYGFPAGYGYTFFAAFLLTSGGLGAFSAVREPPSEELREAEPVLARVLDIPDLLRAEPDFRRFLVARLLGSAARGALPFYVILIGERFGLSGPRLGALTIAFTVAQSVSGIAWGPVGDRAGFRTVFVGALLAWIAGTSLLAVPAFDAMYAVFVLVGAGLGGFMLASQNLVLEFGTARDRPLRIATANSLSELVGMLGFLGAGLLADAAPLYLLFVIATALQLCALAAIRAVAEPRVPIEPVEPID
jgi:MFS family permease